MEKFKQLSAQELRAIRGGDWIRDLGRSCHNVWCAVKDGLEYLNEVGKGGREHFAG